MRVLSRVGSLMLIACTVSSTSSEQSACTPTAGEELTTECTFDGDESALMRLTARHEEGFAVTRRRKNGDARKGHKKHDDDHDDQSTQSESSQSGLRDQSGQSGLGDQSGGSLLQMPNDNNQLCPPLPIDPQVWAEGHLWGVLIDGKDAHLGSHGYDCNTAKNRDKKKKKKHHHDDGDEEESNNTEKHHTDAEDKGGATLLQVDSSFVKPALLPLTPASITGSSQVQPALLPATPPSSQVQPTLLAEHPAPSGQVSETNVTNGTSADKGKLCPKDAYHYFERAMTALQYVYKQETTNPGGDLTLELLEKLQDISFGNAKYMPSSKDIMASGGQILRECTNKMRCENQTRWLEGIPAGLFAYSPATEASACNIQVMPRKSDSKELLTMLLKNYTIDINGAIAAGASPDQLLETLARFLRNFALVHPFKNGNGRMRMLITQREIRRLGIGCGTMMYNNGKSIFVDDLQRYIAKMNEGIRAFERAQTTGKIPWLDKHYVARHKDNFPIPSELELYAGKNFGTAGTID
eukprot:gnl/TRDRNA2_/TRDRNA2_36510_c0_seq1.p1 gnl/TRDRNA2_/TRDRNA2_36510_c0~~gnl/TRDRNA2_/TRDRNA2_36510_c0_seq1.p1  ORF type:complete len:524 (-),score=91.04 gnl/TRDRNA2_/TRDRNA2_36510_c0_seq1:79-1650(-)